MCMYVCMHVCMYVYVCVCVCVNSYVPHSRPLGEVSLVCDPSLFVSAHRVVDIGAPGHVGKHFEQVLHLLW